jgi:DNA-binding NarL/FixJ family response regulator
MAVKVVIADDNGLFRTALEAILDSEEGIEVVGRATDGEEAAAVVAERSPDVVLMDLSMPVLDGFEATRRIRSETPGTSVVVLTGSLDETDMHRAADAGAVAYVTKDRILSDLVDAIVAAAAGRGSLS